jgi:hypothetical protein
MLDRKSEKLYTSAYLATLPVESRIEYVEKLLDELARSIWGDSFNKADKEKMESIADKMFHGVKQVKEIALQILEED